MAITQAQRASLHVNLVDLMGQQDADALIEMLPPGGWENVATKDDLKTLETTLRAAITTGLAETNAAITAGLAETNAAIIETNATITAGLAEATKERAQLALDVARDARQEARNLFITISTIVLATISIWIALVVTVVSAG